MRVFRFLAALALLAPALSLAACDDATGVGGATIVTDTLTIGAPPVAGLTVPTALDVVVVQGIVLGGGRFPENPGDAEAWDVALRLSGGQFTLAPRGAVGVDGRRAGITDPLTVGFDALEEAPASARYKTTEAVPLRAGGVYVVRSRSYGVGGGSCFHYAKLQPLELDPAAGTARLVVASSGAFCGDTRLVDED
ncbi:MAG TPA: hypothetical protein VF263_19025 [Longimicrobiaceae bacterium]